MKGLFRDAVALAGVGSLSSGLYLKYDAGTALIAVGTLLLVLVVGSFWNKGG